jgi:Uri superfamily endonuclease
MSIYQITDKNHTKRYIGSTTESLSTRFSRHRRSYQKRFYSCHLLFDEFGIDNCIIELLEQVQPEELKVREGWYIKNNECVNLRDEAVTYEESLQKNREWYYEHREERNRQIAQRKRERRALLKSKQSSE